MANSSTGTSSQFAGPCPLQFGRAPISRNPSGIANSSTGTSSESAASFPLQLGSADISRNLSGMANSSTGSSSQFAGPFPLIFGSPDISRNLSGMANSSTGSSSQFAGTSPLQFASVPISRNLSGMANSSTGSSSQFARPFPLIFGSPDISRNLSGMANSSTGSSSQFAGTSPLQFASVPISRNLSGMANSSTGSSSQFAGPFPLIFGSPDISRNLSGMANSSTGSSSQFAGTSPLQFASVPISRNLSGMANSSTGSSSQFAGTSPLQFASVPISRNLSGMANSSTGSSSQFAGTSPLQFASVPISRNLSGMANSSTGSSSQFAGTSPLQFASVPISRNPSGMANSSTGTSSESAAPFSVQLGSAHISRNPSGMANSSTGSSSQFAGTSPLQFASVPISRYWGEEANHFATAPLSPETYHVLMVVTTDQDQRREAQLLRYKSEGEALEVFRQLVKSSTLPPLDSSDVIYLEIDSLTTPKATRYTLETLLGEEENVKKLYNCCEGRKISYSQTYKNIVRDLLVLHMDLRKVGLSMKFDLGSIGMSVDYYLGMDHYTLRALNLKVKSEREKDDNDGLIMLINNMNVRAGITLEMVENSLELKKVIDGLRGSGELRVDDIQLVFFWDHNRRVNFIEAVHTLFQNKSGEFYIKNAGAAHLSPLVESLFETNWETSFDSDPMLRLLRRQDYDDRVRFGITQLVGFDKTQQHLRKEVGLRNTVDLMRQTNYHLVRMTKDLLNAGEIARGIDEYELELRFEKAFPDLLQKLVDALSFYTILLGCRVRRFELSSHGSSFVIE